MVVDVPKIDPIEVPTRQEMEAWSLRTRSGLKDHQGAELLGVRRETFNRRVNRAVAKFRRLADVCGHDCAEQIKRRVIAG